MRVRLHAFSDLTETYSSKKLPAITAIFLHFSKFFRKISMDVYMHLHLNGGIPPLVNDEMFDAIVQDNAESLLLMMPTRADWPVINNALYVTLSHGHWKPLTLAVQSKSIACARILMRRKANPKQKCFGLHYKWPGLTDILKECWNEPNDVPYYTKLYYQMEYTAIQAAILCHGPYSRMADLMRGNRLLKLAFHSWKKASDIKRCVAVLLCAKQKKCVFYRLSKELIVLILQYTYPNIEFAP